jgi:NADH dehydrogenase
MKIAITGGTGFAGRNIARQLAQEGHEVVLVARGRDQTDPLGLQNQGARFFQTGVDDAEKLTRAFAGCDAVAHCAGINRELGAQTYRRVHIEGTRNVVHAAQRAGVRKIALISFLRARPNCGSAYHESKWAAEEIVRACGLDYTVFKCGVIYGKGDHMLDHLSHAFHTFPLFAFVGFRDRPIRPNAVEDVARMVAASLAGGALSRRTVAVLGPEELTLREAVRRVARVVGRRPLMFPMPIWFHYVLGWCVERVMTVPLVSIAQVRMLAEGLAEPLPPCAAVPPGLAPTIPFCDEQILKGLPPTGPFRLRDLRCGCHGHSGLKGIRGVFFLKCHDQVYGAFDRKS